ncbi:40S ribosome biogenesis protein Tsr1 and BMS1 C-terminal [Rhizoctonia solani]|uniref:40S ribosome biogenesis protein Tsr1 and BMS1 C-terminal n=1 Tax=Rhizoctonia solani TaxID=456999 RepID=A0A8H8P944_9AGAM|nr:40S ribosome biogenesis protein Tsr1 and BMS1 C-terminal [Rhizoctonia solani]QRW26880.1 40S ribosome biogenesis protein Tsr1 and BMS1 C-terminal [Rhizoctonia solani]
MKRILEFNDYIQQNKPFKSKHASKGSLKAAAKGRVGNSPKSQPAASVAIAQTKLNRKNSAKQNQLKKKAELADEGKIFTPRIVAIVPLCPDVSAQQTALQIVKSLGVDASSAPQSGTWIVEAPRFRTTLQFLILPYQVDTWGERLLRVLQSQGGLHNVVSTVSHSDGSRTQPAIQKSLLSFVQYFVPTQNRVFDLTTESDARNAARALCEGVPRTGPASASWRDGRSWIAAENVDWEENGELRITGVVRGSALTANRLVHIPSLGDFQISKVLAAPRPRAHKHSAEVTMDVTPTDMTIIAERQPSDADSLTSTNRPDEMTNEQTWPTAEELAEGEAREASALKASSKKSKIKRVPRGTSTYQAAWIVDDADDEDEGDEDEDADADMEAEANVGEGQEEEEDMVELDEEAEDDPAMSVTNSKAGKSVAFEDMDVEEEARQLDTWRTREREDADDLAFPDEIDTPQDTPARTRFARYRGLRSLRTSPWDPYENLPQDYARTFQFEDYARTERSVRKYEDEHAAKPATRVVVCVESVPRDVVRLYGPGRPLIMFTLLQHEHKVSVLNFTVQRNTEYNESVRSKDPMILCVGPRRLRTNPVYSQHTRGGGKGVNNVHKFERYLRHGDASVATIYGPIVFGKQPCTLLRETGDPEAPELVAYGSFHNTDAQRIIAKRIILTGHPFKVHKKTATVRYMFFNPEDVRYFAPTQLHTKHGRTGHIRESLGTMDISKLTSMALSPRWTPGQDTNDDVAMEE